jgi:LPS-assembly protein
MSWMTALPFPPRRAVALSALVSVAAGQLHAQNAAPPRANDEDQPVNLQAEEIVGRPDRELNLYRNAEITRGATGVTADTACYRRVEDEVKAEGHIDMWRFGDRYKGDALQLNLETNKGWVQHPSYHLGVNNGQGTASRIDFVGEGQAVVIDGTYSTCDGPDPDWYLKSSTLRLDQGRDTGQANRSIIYFKGLPILGTPALSFSLSGARRSGWLPAVPGVGAKGAVEVMVPYYFNIAPNRDLTLYPRYIFSRGLLMGATGRYMGEAQTGPYLGETHVEFMAKDRIAHRSRWLVDTLHSQVLAPGWSFGWNAHGASDNDYPSDFSRTVAASAERQLLRDLHTEYNRQYWAVGIRAQSYQVLQDPAAVKNRNLTVYQPYNRLPQVTFHAGRFDVLGGFDWALDAEAVQFQHPQYLELGGKREPTPSWEGNRTNLVGQVSYPWVHPGWFITPKAMFHATKYNLNRDVPGQLVPQLPVSERLQLSRTLPTFSLDSGLIFERDSSLFGKDGTQTLEPRLFYVRTPYKMQDNIPIFDTGVAGFNYAQLFTENRFVGADRVSDANQLTAAIVTRFIESNGLERLRIAVGSRYYFTDPQVHVDANEARNQTRSDALVTASGRISETWSFDSGVQYDAQGRSLYSSNLGVQWQPAPMKVLNAEYRYQRDTFGPLTGFRNAEVSGQWPLTTRWYGVGRVSYSVRDKKLLESLVGLEYKADCWIFRTGAQRFVTTAQKITTQMFLQLELNGLSSLGSSGKPSEIFNRSIPGYTRLNTTAGRL